MICDIEVDRILTKTHGLIEERSAGGITTHVFLGVVADFNAKVFPLELKTHKGELNNTGVYTILYEGNKVYNGFTESGVNRIYQHISDKKRKILPTDLAMYIYSSEGISVSAAKGAEWEINDYIFNTYGEAPASVADNQKVLYEKHKDYIDTYIIDTVSDLIRGTPHAVMLPYKQPLPIRNVKAESVVTPVNYLSDDNSIFIEFTKTHTHNCRCSKTIIKCLEKKKRGKVVLKAGSIVNIRTDISQAKLREYEKNAIANLQKSLIPYLSDNVLIQDIPFDSYSKAVKACCGCDAKNTDAQNKNGMTYTDWLDA